MRALMSSPLTFLRQINTAFLLTTKSLPECILNSIQLRCFSFTNILTHRGRDLSPPLQKSEVKFAAKLKETRKRLNISQMELGSLFGAHGQRVSDFENLRMRPGTWRKWENEIAPWLESRVLSDIEDGY